MKKKENYIDGLKGVLCVLIMLGHYFGIYKYATVTGRIDNSILFFIKNNCISSLLFNESFWLYGFFVISGYLIAHTNVDSIKIVLLAIIKRFLRFLLPIIGACIFIYIMYLSIGFNNYETLQFFENPYYQYKNNYSVLYWYDIILDPFKTVLIGGSKFNAPYWVIKSMFIGSIYVYALSYIKNEKKIFILPVLFIICGCIFFLPYKSIAISIILGACLYWFKDIIDKILTRYFMLFVILTIPTILIMKYVGSNIGYVTFFMFLMVYIEKYSLLKNIFSSKIMLFLGRYSFGIYSFHFPVFISIGAMILIKLFSLNVSGIETLFITWGVCITITILISVIYNITLEKWSMIIINKVDKLKTIKKRRS